MSITVIADMKAKGGQVDALREMLSSHLPDTRARPGCESVTVHQDQDSPDTIVLIEQWASRQHQNDYLVWLQGQQDMEGFVALLDGPGPIRYLDFLGG